MGLYAYSASKSDETKPMTTEPPVVRIEQILSNPRQYHGKQTSVQGVVVSSFNIWLKVYQIDDTTGRIFVKTAYAVPMKGHSVRVSGNINQVFKLFGRHVVLLEEAGY